MCAGFQGLISYTGSGIDSACQECAVRTFPCRASLLLSHDSEFISPGTSVTVMAAQDRNLVVWGITRLGIECVCGESPQQWQSELLACWSSNLTLGNQCAHTVRQRGMTLVEARQNTQFGCVLRWGPSLVAPPLSSYVNDPGRNTCLLLGQ